MRDRNIVCIGRQNSIDILKAVFLSPQKAETDILVRPFSLHPQENPVIFACRSPCACWEKLCSSLFPCIRREKPPVQSVFAGRYIESCISVSHVRKKRQTFHLVICFASAKKDRHFILPVCVTFSLVNAVQNR